MIRRITIIVLDSLGLGALPDAEKFGDKGADTFGHIADEYDLNIPNLLKLGLGNIDGAAGGRLKIGDKPLGAYGRFAEKSVGKDTITGHWEIAGLYTDTPFKTYPDGFPQEVMDAFEKAIGRGWLGNFPASGTEIIEQLGEEHERTGKVIVYTSADSVFQIAANVDIVPLEELYDICEKARELLQGEYACGRVIARPYIIEGGKRTRTSDRKDYAVSPPEPTMLDIISDEGKTVYAIGKIKDIFNGSGVTRDVHTESNDDGVTKTIEALREDFEGLIFTNLVDFDSKFGHRRDAEGYGKAIEEFDNRLPEIMAAMKEDDVLILCSDHGNDPIHTGWDHTREYILGIAAGAGIKENINLGTRESFADIGATVVDMLTDGKKKTSIGKSFRDLIEK